MNLVFDTETTGFPQPHLPTTDPLQPYVVQLAAALFEDDGTERACMNVTIAPDGWEISARSSAIHGITAADASRYGVRQRTAAVMFSDMMKRASRLVAHNITFDIQVIATMLARSGAPDIVFPDRYCTMQVATPLVNMPPTAKMIAAGFNHPKAPKLEECIRHFFDEPLDGAHDAMVDVRACARLFFHLKSLSGA